MNTIIVDDNKCTLCLKCIDVCPFSALEIYNEKITVNASCKMCKLCVKHCPENALSVRVNTKTVDKSLWNGYLIFAEINDNRLHPVVIELIGASKELSKQTKMPISVIVIGYKVLAIAQTILSYGVDNVFIYDDKRLCDFRSDVYANVMEDLISDLKPSVVLVGATAIGRSLARRTAIRFQSGLTADCTSLKIKPNTDLVQIRPAFGGNIMAQIITPNARPQFATVRHKVMDSATLTDRYGQICPRQVSEHLLNSKIQIVEIIKHKASLSISEVEVLVAGGQGLKNISDLNMIKELACLLGGEFACTRPLVEKGWCDYTRQIGLSGRTVRPKLIITFGVSGAIQFTACMNSSEFIIAINIDKKAPIMEIANIGIIGNLYDILPSLIIKIKGNR